MHKLKDLLPMLAITLLAILLRAPAITTHSLWWDELTTMKTADVAFSFSEVLEVSDRSADPAPRTFYIILNLWFKLFGYSDFTARFFVMLFGILAVPVIYLLGKELKDSTTGHIAALVTAVNYYHIYYSLDVRFYSLLFFLSALSYLFFWRLARSTADWKNLVLYCIFTYLLLTVHYFGLFVLFTEAVAWLFIKRSSFRQNFAKTLKSSWFFVAIGVAYVPFLWGLLKTLGTRTAALSGNPGNDFFISYFMTYFGYSAIPSALAAMAFLFFVIRYFLVYDKEATEKAFILLLWILLPPVLAYIRTLFGSPTMGERYFIIVLPALFATIALGINAIKTAYMKAGFLALFTLACITNITGEIGFYTTPVKDDFRGAASFVGSKTGPATYHVLSDKSYHFKYYFDQFGMGPVLLDHAVHSDQRFYLSERQYQNNNLVADTTLKDLWVISAHFANLDNMKAVARELAASNQFILLDTFQGKDAFAHHFIRKSWRGARQYYPALNEKQIGLNDFDLKDDDKINLEGGQAIALWGYDIYSRPIPLQAGNYRLTLMSKGDPALDIYPKVRVQANGVQIGEFEATGEFETYSFKIELDDTAMVIGFIMENDYYNAETNEDRNAFLKNIRLSRNTETF